MELQLVELPVQAVLLHQFLVRPFLADRSAMEHQNTVGVPGFGAKNRYALFKKISWRYGWSHALARTDSWGAGKFGEEYDVTAMNIAKTAG